MENLVVGVLFHEDLVVDVVIVGRHEDVNVPHDLEGVDSLLKGPRRQVDINGLDPIPLLGQIPHLGIGPPVVEGDRGQVVEDGVKVVPHSGY